MLEAWRPKPLATALVVALGMAAAPAIVRAQPDGATLFAQNCSACHQKHGEGVKGAFPALAGDALVQGPPDIAAVTVLYGRGGMPAFAPDLSDATIAAILTYVRGAWANHAAAIDTATVTRMRASGAPPKTDMVLQAH